MLENMDSFHSSIGATCNVSNKPKLAKLAFAAALTLQFSKCFKLLNEAKIEVISDKTTANYTIAPFKLQLATAGKPAGR